MLFQFQRRVRDFDQLGLRMVVSDGFQPEQGHVTCLEVLALNLQDTKITKSCCLIVAHHSPQTKGSNDPVVPGPIISLLSIRLRSSRRSSDWNERVAVK